MSTVEIQTTAGMEPIRQTFSHVARAIGGDKPASRYQEGTIGLQSQVNFHYKPLWEPELDLYDKRRTRIEMRDWDAFKDPRQFYYGTYVLNRAKLQEMAESNFNFVEKRGGLSSLPKGLTRRIAALMLPLRHVEWGANTTNCQITMFGWGGAFTQATMYATMDRLGIAQYLSRIGLMMDGQTGTSLTLAREQWLSEPVWQPLRKLVEDMFVVKDWFELHIAQNVVLDGLMYPLVYQRFSDELSQQGASVVAMLTEFMDTWFAEHGKWVDAVSRVGVVSVAWPVKPHELPGWIDRRLRERGLRAAPDAVQGLSEKAKTLAAQAEEKARELAEQAEAKLDKVKADAEKVVDSARERLKSAGKDDKKA